MASRGTSYVSFGLLDQRDVRHVHPMDSEGGLSASCVSEPLLDKLSRLPQRFEAAAHALLGINYARHPSRIDAAQHTPPDSDRQGKRACVRPDSAALPQAVAAAPSGCEQLQNLLHIAREGVMWIAGPHKEREQSLPFLITNERNVRQAGCAAEDGQFLSHHVPVDGERCEPMGRVMDHHLQTLECRDIARPGDAPR